MKQSGAILCTALVVTAAATWPLAGQMAAPSIPACAGPGLPDRDRDGLSDACESALASTFAPLLTVRSGGCNWNATSARPGGGYFHAVQTVDSLLRIAYLPAYLRDCGWSGAKCLIPWVDCSPHDGDSEIIIVEVDPDAAPVIWVSEGRNASYPTWRACDEGHGSLDTCDRHDARFRFPVDAARNIGSRLAPMSEGGCVRGANLDDGAQADPRAEECFWRPDARFRGWQVSGTGVTPYARYLLEIAGF